MLPRLLRLGLLGLSIAAAQVTAAAQVKVWQDSIQLPTYAEGDPDPNPQFPALIKDEPANYPYPFRSNVTTAPQARSMATWRTLNLENEFLSCRVLPDLGGHIYNCLDKIANREIFHVAQVIKKAMIGQRGAWISTGIEVNFPVTHSRVSVAPLNFVLRNEPGGAASIAVSDTDRVTGLHWRVEYRLRPGVAVLEQRVTFYNPTPERKPYLWWNNAAIEWDDPGIRYILPTHLVAAHNHASIETWPVSSTGVDMSVVANDRAETIWFASGSREPFMGIYKPKFRTGVAHYADAATVAGKKLWIMAQDQMEDYRKRLTDGGNLYVELQAGLFADQETYAFLGPEQSRSFAEYWIPFRDLSGLTRATPDVVLNAQRNGGRLEVELSSTHAIAGAKIRILRGGTPVSEAAADLDPKTVWKGTSPAGLAEPLEIQVLDSKGTLLLDHHEGIYNADGASGIKTGPQRQTDWNGIETEDLLLRRGDYNETLNQTVFAHGDYASGLKRFPQDLEFDKAAGRLAVSLGQFKEAASALNHALDAPALDYEALYYAGAAAAQSGRDGDAVRLLGQVSAASEFGAAASLELAFAAARTGDVARALKLLAPLAADPGRGPRIAAIRAALLRRTGDKTSALAQVRTALAIAPEDALARWEAAASGGASDPGLFSYLAGDAERVLDIADEYMRLGMWEDAATVLTHDYAKDKPEFLEPGAVPPSKSALAAYYAAFCEQQMKKDAAPEFARASALGTRYQFPSRASSHAVLAAALEHNPSDATAHALLGNLEMYSLRLEDAAAEYQKALGLNSTLAVERKSMTLALAELRQQTKPAAKAEPAVTRAVTPAVPGAASAAVARPESPAGNADAALKLASGAILTAATTKAPQSVVATFRDPAFAAEKQPAAVRQAYIEVQLQVLLAQSRDKKCENIHDQLDALGLEDESVPFTLYGFGQFMRTPHFQFYLGVVEANCGNAKQAEKYWAKTAKLKEPPASADFAYPVLAASRLKLPEEKTSLAEAQRALQGAEGRAQKGAEGTDTYALNAALLLRARGQEAQAVEGFQKIERESSDVFLRYLATVELSRNP